MKDIGASSMPESRAQKTNCKTCNAGFKKYTSPSRKGRGIYCSKKCLYLGRDSAIRNRIVGFKFNKKKHGWDSRIHNVWNSMKKRCYKEKTLGYARYGGRGISVCDAWLNDYPAFLMWAMGSGYKSGLTLDRIDNNGNYAPENCRWTTMLQQNRNHSRNKLTLKLVKEMRLLRKKGMRGWDLAKKFNIARGHVYDICNNRVWSQK